MSTPVIQDMTTKWLIEGENVTENIKLLTWGPTWFINRGGNVFYPWSTSEELEHLVDKDKDLKAKNDQVLVGPAGAEHKWTWEWTTRHNMQDTNKPGITLLLKEKAEQEAKDQDEDEEQTETNNTEKSMIVVGAKYHSMIIVEDKAQAQTAEERTSPERLLEAWHKTTMYRVSQFKRGAPAEFAC